MVRMPVYPDFGKHIIFKFCINNIHKNNDYVLCSHSVDILNTTIYTLKNRFIIEYVLKIDTFFDQLPSEIARNPLTVSYLL